MKTAKDLELSLLVKEAHIQQLKLKIKELESEIERLNILIKEEHEVSQMYLNNIINTIDYIEMCKTLAGVDEKIIFSISTLEKILKGERM